MKKTILCATLLLAMICGFAQVTTKTETSKKEGVNKQIKVTVTDDGKTTIIDTVITMENDKTPKRIEKIIQGQNGTQHLVIKMDSLNDEAIFSDDEIGPMNKDHRKVMIKKIRKNMKSSMPPMDFDLPDMDILKEFSFDVPERPMNLKLHFPSGMHGRLHKIDDEEFAQLRKIGVLTDKEDLAEKLDVRFINTSPCGEDCQVINFVSKEKGKINVTLIEREGKVVDKTDAEVVSKKEVDGRNVFSCVINLGKDKKFTFIKLTKDGKLSLFSNGY